MIASTPAAAERRASSDSFTVHTPSFSPRACTASTAGASPSRPRSPPARGRSPRAASPNPPPATTPPRRPRPSKNPTPPPPSGRPAPSCAGTWTTEAFGSGDTLFSEIKRAEPSKVSQRFCLVSRGRHNESSDVPNLKARTPKAVEFRCPEAAERTAIAEVLSEMDAELEALKRRREKTRALKQAMMQQHLPDQTRLVCGCSKTP